MILTLARALVLIAFAHQARAVERAACGYATPCDPRLGHAAVEIIRARWRAHLPLFLRP